MIAVSKGRTIQELSALYRLGVRDFAENRALELERKTGLDSASDIRCHFIGNVQSNQCQRIGRCADVVHSLDRPNTASVLATAIGLRQNTLSGFLQVNIAGHATRNGIRCESWERNTSQLHNVLDVARDLLNSTDLRLHGLMMMTPMGLSPRDQHRLFARTRELLCMVREVEPRMGPSLSMGMSDDFEIAIAEGATHVRLGRILFEREHKPADR